MSVDAENWKPASEESPSRSRLYGGWGRYLGQAKRLGAPTGVELGDEEMQGVPSYDYVSGWPYRWS